MKKTMLITVFLLLFQLNVSGNPFSARLSENLITLDYGGYKLFFDCNMHGAAYFYYKTVKDAGNYDKRPDFKFDNRLQDRCKQFSNNDYSEPGQHYEQGHLVPCNHFDSDKSAYESTFIMANVLPQTRTLNRGAWKKTENIIECYRDIETLEVWGGPIWGDDETNDFFVESHGVKTPDYFWKVIFTGSRVLALKIPNSYEAKSEYIHNWFVSVREIEDLTGISIDIPNRFKDIKPSMIWKYPEGCDLK